MEIAFFWLAFGIIGYLIGSAKERGISGVLLGIFFGPLGWLIIFLMKGNQIRCRSCYSWISPYAKICPKCQSAVASKAVSAGNNQNISFEEWKNHYHGGALQKTLPPEEIERKYQEFLKERKSRVSISDLAKDL